MKTITIREIDKYETIRIENYRNYVYGVIKNKQYYTISQYQNGPISIQPIGFISEQIVKSQKLIKFVNDHAAIHINPKKHVWRWQDD